MVWRALKRWYDLGAQKTVGNTSLPQGLQTKPSPSLPRGGDRIQIITRCLLNEPNFFRSAQETQHVFSTNTASLPNQRMGKAVHPTLTAGTLEGQQGGTASYAADKAQTHKTKDY